MNKKLIKDFSYPDPSDKDIQEKLFKKREFFYHQIQPRPIINTYEDVKTYREQICGEDTFKPREQQAILSNLINPNTLYKGLLIMHGTGTGKSCSAISIAEQFKEQIKKYNTKIYILSFGPNGKVTLKNELLFCTNDTYLKNQGMKTQLTKVENENNKRIALNVASQFYKILSYKSFYKKVLGEKIIEKKLSDNKKIKSTYRKNNEGDIEREIILDRITNMNNTILIVDEAHNLTNNEFGASLTKIIKNSENLRIVLLSATPMKNSAADIIPLLNFIRPENDQIIKDKVFTKEKGHIYTMELKTNGLEYFKKMASGYVSFYRGNMPYTFAKRDDRGIIPKGLLFTPVIKCFMKDFQYNGYFISTKKYDPLVRASSSAANFIFPGFNQERNNIMGYHSTEGLNNVINQLETDGPKLKSFINKYLLNNTLSVEEEENFILVNENKILTGLFLKKKYLKYFSIKFYKALKKLEKLFLSEKNKLPGIAFIYSNLVKAGGVELFAEVLIQNGYLEYQENSKNYDIKDETIDYKTGKTFIEFKKNNKSNDFKPATFIIVTGSVDDAGEDVPEIKQKIIKEIYNSVENIDGKLIKLCLGSKVMNESVTLENVKEIHILDVHFNLGKVEQVIGRGIRMCKHHKSIHDNNRFPKVKVYRYVVSIPFIGKKTKENKKNSILSSDEILYQKAELKYLLVKDIEHALREVAVDCPLLFSNNVFPEEIEQYKGCVYPTLENIEAGKKICPALCNFRECNFKCDSKKLNDNYYDEKTNSYRNMIDVDFNTFNDNLAQVEISLIKQKIKDLYRFKYVYLYDELLHKIKKNFNEHQAKLFNKYFLDKAIEDLLPHTHNDFNNFKDYVYDKFNNQGYLIQRDKYYIFQPIDENENITMFYRENLPIKQNNLVSIKNYIKQRFGNVKIKDIQEIEESKNIIKYNFTDNIDYYKNREENFIIGIIDIKNNNDVFKIREKFEQKIDIKKKINPIPSSGAVCFTTRDKQYLIKLHEKIKNITNVEFDDINKLSKEDICNLLKIELLYLEKYSTTKDKNKLTYMIIPTNHSFYPFPYNLEDRIKDRINKINSITGKNIDIVVHKNTKKDIIYTLIFENDESFDNDKLEKLGCILEKKQWKLILD